MGKPKRTTYTQAMEVSWPRGRYLVSLMEGLPTSKRERTTLKALRVARETLEKQIQALILKKDQIDQQIRRECPHLTEFLSVSETRVPAAEGVPAHTLYSVECNSCQQTLRKYPRNE